VGVHRRANIVGNGRGRHCVKTTPRAITATMADDADRPAGDVDRPAGDVDRPADDVDRPAADDTSAGAADQPSSAAAAAVPEAEAAQPVAESAESPGDADDGTRPVIQIEAPTPSDAQSEAAAASQPDSPTAAPAPAAPEPAPEGLPALSIYTTAPVAPADGNAATAAMPSSQSDSFQPPPFLAVTSPVAPPAGSGSAATSPVRATEPSLAYLGTRLSSAGPTVLPHQVRRSRQEPASPAPVVLPEPAPRLTLADRIAAAIRSLAAAAAGGTPEREQVVPSRLGPWPGAAEADSGRTTPPRLRRRRRGPPPGEAGAAGRVRPRGQDGGDGDEHDDEYEYSDTDEYDEGEEAEEVSDDEAEDDDEAAAGAAEQQEQQETGIIAEILNWWRGSAVPPPGPQRPRRARSVATAEPSVVEAADEPDPSAYDPRMHHHRQSAGRMLARNAGEPFGPLAAAMPDDDDDGDDGYRLAGSRWTIEPTARAFARAGGPLDPDALGEPAFEGERDARRARAPASRVVPSAGAGPDVPGTLDEPELFASLATHAHRRAAGRVTGTAGDGLDDPSALEDPGHLGAATVRRDRRAAGRVAAAAAGGAAVDTMDEPELLAAQQSAARARAHATAEPFSALSALPPPGEDGVAAGAGGRGGRARAMAGATVYDAPRDPYSDAEPAYDGASDGTVEEALAGSGSSASGAGDADDEATSTVMSASTSRRRVSRASQGLWPAILGAAPWWLGGGAPFEEDELDENGRIPIEAQYQGPIDLRQTFMFAPFKHWRRLYCVIVDDGLELCKSYKDTRLLAYLPLVQSCICYEDVEDADDATPRRVVELHLASGDMYTFRCPNEQEAADLIAAVRKRTAALNLEVVPYLYLTMPMPVGFAGQPLKFGWVRARIDASSEWLWRTFTLTDYMLCIGLSAPADSEELLDCALKCFNAELRAREQLPSDLDIAPADRPRTFALRTSRGVVYVRAELRSEMLEWLNAIKFASVMAVIRQNEFSYRCDWNYGEHRREVRLLLRRTSGVHLLSADGRTELRHYYFKDFMRCRLFGDLMQLDFGQPDDDILELRTAEPTAISIVLNTMLDLAGRTVNQTQNGSLWHPGRDRVRSQAAKAAAPALQAH